MKYFSIENEFGLFFHSSKGFLTKAELKYYWEEENEGLYFSASLYYKHQKYSTTEYSPTEDKLFSVTKNVECLTLKFGNLHVFKFGLSLEPYGGIGIRFQQNQNSLTPLENSQMQGTTDYGPNMILNQARNRVYPNLTAGLKVGFRLIN